MSCGCSNQAGSANSGEVIEPIGPTFILPEETIECYMARSPGDPAPTEPEQENKIATLTIPVDCEMKVDTTFKMTEGSETPDEWKLEIKDSQGNVVSPDSIGLIYDSGTPKLSGTIKDEFEKKGFVANMKANKGGETLDEKTYKFIGKKCTQGDLRLINPNPGGVFTSKFGPRKSPVPGASTNHKGLDISTGGKADILAAADGIVSKAGVGTGYGNVVYILHKDGSGKILAETRYAHLSRIYVSNGQQVSAGQPIGKEGNTGIGTGPHLHFEVRLGGSIPDDPMKYINGEIIAGANMTKADPGDISGPTSVIKQEKKAITREEVEYKQGCTPLENNPNGHAKDPANKKNPGGKSPDNQVFHKSVCRPAGPEGKPSKDDVKSRMQAQLDKHPELDSEDKKYMMNTFKIESSYDPYATAGTTTALGPFQMVNKTAEYHFKRIGVEPTCENRCNIEYATDAQIDKYLQDKKVYDEFQNKGTILGKKPPSNYHTAEYGNMTKGEFIYLIHHDGIGSVQRGKDLQGLGYYRTHAPT